MLDFMPSFIHSMGFHALVAAIVACNRHFQKSAKGLSFTRNSILANILLLGTGANYASGRPSSFAKRTPAEGWEERNP